MGNGPPSSSCATKKLRGLEARQTGSRGVRLADPGRRRPRPAGAGEIEANRKRDWILFEDLIQTGAASGSGFANHAICVRNMSTNESRMFFEEPARSERAQRHASAHSDATPFWLKKFSNSLCKGGVNQFFCGINNSQNALCGAFEAVCAFSAASGAENPRLAGA